MIDEGVVVIGSKEGAREDNRVERNIVLSHELVELYLVRVLPPFFPLRCVAGSDGKIPICNGISSWHSLASDH